MNPATYLQNDLSDIRHNDAVKEGDKLTTYQFESAEQVKLIHFIWRISYDYDMDVNEVLLRYIPDIESKKTIYTFIRTDKHHGNRWVVLRKEGGEEIVINVYKTYNCFYSVNS